MYVFPNKMFMQRRERKEMLKGMALLAFLVGFIMILYVLAG